MCKTKTLCLWLSRQRHIQQFPCHKQRVVRYRTVLDYAKRPCASASTDIVCITFALICFALPHLFPNHLRQKQSAVMLLLWELLAKT